MNDAVHLEDRVSRLARVRDEELRGAEGTAGARTLLASVVTEAVPASDPVTTRRRGAPSARRVALVASAVGAMTVAVVVAPSLLEDGTGTATSYANSAIDVRREGGFFVARIKDPVADRARFVEAFRAVGQDVEIELVPVAKQRVGQLLEASGGGPGAVEASTDLVSSGGGKVDCALKPESCTMVIRISADTRGWNRYKFGRAARPGEALYEPGLPEGAQPGRTGTGTGTGSGGERSGGGG